VHWEIPKAKPAEEGGGIPPLVGIAAIGTLVYALVRSL